VKQRPNAIMPRTMVPLFLSIVLVSIAQLLMKFGMLQRPSTFSIDSLSASSWPGFAGFLESLPQYSAMGLPVLAGIGCYCASVLCWMKALQYVRLSIAYPMLSFSYLIVQLAAVMIPAFNETLQPQRLVGTALLMVGICLCAVPDRAASDTQ
jgi:undecaprenyl phosphate-alpha-L-ara4N flippase subunit ArnF